MLDYFLFWSLQLIAGLSFSAVAYLYAVIPFNEILGLEDFPVALITKLILIAIAIQVSRFIDDLDLSPFPIKHKLTKVIVEIKALKSLNILTSLYSKLIQTAAKAVDGLMFLVFFLSIYLAANTNNFAAYGIYFLFVTVFMVNASTYYKQRKMIKATTK